MELSDLHVFRAVARCGGVTRAAGMLHRVQSNVTTRVRKLEDELGVVLFVRENRRMRLSPDGKVLLEYAERLLNLADEARAALHDAPSKGVVKLGAMESTAAVRLPAPLTLLHARHPAISVELHIGAPQAMMTAVLAGELDAALVAEPVTDRRLAVEVIYDEALVIVAAAGQAAIRSPRDITNRTLLAFHPGCPHRSRLEDWFKRFRVLPDRLVELGSYHAILGCAVAGMGVALMPSSVVDAYSERTRLSVHPLGGRFKSARTMLVWRRDSPQRHVALFADVLRDTARKVLTRRPGLQTRSQRAP